MLLQEGSSERPPLFWCHDLHGSAFRFQALARALGPDQTLYGFESPFLDPAPPPFRSIQMLALAYATEMVRREPEGPYHLGGYSFGGILAFEVAQQLLRDGHEVALLVVVDVGPAYRGINHDTHHPPPKPWLGLAPPADPDAPVLERVRHYVRMPPKVAARHLVWRAGLDGYLEPYLFWRDRRQDGRIAPSHRLWYAWRKHWQLAKAWADEEHTYPGRIELVWADESGSDDATMGWGAVAEGGVGISRVPVRHEQLMEEGSVDATAAVVRELLDRRFEG